MTLLATFLTTAALISAYTLVVRAAAHAIRWTRLLIAEMHFKKIKEIGTIQFKKNSNPFHVERPNI